MPLVWVFGCLELVLYGIVERMEKESGEEKEKKRPDLFSSDWLDIVHSVALIALSCHKEPAQGTQSLLLGAFLP